MSWYTNTNQPEYGETNSGQLRDSIAVLTSQGRSVVHTGGARANSSPSLSNAAPVQSNATDHSHNEQILPSFADFVNISTSSDQNVSTSATTKHGVEDETSSTVARTKRQGLDEDQSQPVETQSKRRRRGGRPEEAIITDTAGIQKGAVVTHSVFSADHFSSPNNSMLQQQCEQSMEGTQVWEEDQYKLDSLYVWIRNLLYNTEYYGVKRFDSNLSIRLKLDHCSFPLQNRSFQGLVAPTCKEPVTQLYGSWHVPRSKWDPIKLEKIFACCQTHVANMENQGMQPIPICRATNQRIFSKHWLAQHGGNTHATSRLRCSWFAITRHKGDLAYCCTSHERNKTTMTPIMQNQENPADRRRDYNLEWNSISASQQNVTQLDIPTVHLQGFNRQSGVDPSSLSWSTSQGNLLISHSQDLVGLAAAHPSTCNNSHSVFTVQVREYTDHNNTVLIYAISSNTGTMAKSAENNDEEYLKEKRITRFHPACVCMEVSCKTVAFRNTGGVALCEKHFWEAQ